MLEEKVKINFIGSGNVCWHLVRQCLKNGIEIGSIVYRSNKNISLYPRKIKHKFVSTSSDLDSGANITFLTVNDDNIGLVCEMLWSRKKHSGLLLHTSGTKSSEILSRFSHNYASFYPLQTLKISNKISFKKSVPILLTGNQEGIYLAKILAEKLEPKKIKVVSNEEKLRLHLAAVIVNNFANHLSSKAFNFLNDPELFSLLIPLMKQTTLNISKGNPKDMQTGPAIRNDINTIKNHLELLKGHKNLSELYKLISKDINRDLEI